MPPSHFYPRPPRGGRHAGTSIPRSSCMIFLSTPSARRATSDPAARGAGLAISIHALREEGDLDAACGCGDARNISIHALREEGDKPPTGFVTTETYFYPRPPRGGRLVTSVSSCSSSGFLSTPSARRATADIICMMQGAPISIHALREEGDQRTGCRCTPLPYFYPRPPRGGRPGTP